MKKIFNKKVLSVVVLTLVLTLVMGMAVFATNVVNANNPTSTDLNGYVKTLTNNIRGFAAVFVALSAVITALLYMTGSVNPKLKDKAKDALFALIVGVIILVLSGNIAGWVGDITGKTVNNDGTITFKAPVETVDYNQYC